MATNYFRDNVRNATISILGGLGLTAAYWVLDTLIPGFSVIAGVVLVVGVAMGAFSLLTE